jgi:hypothetical protein
MGTDQWWATQKVMVAAGSPPNLMEPCVLAQMLFAADCDLNAGLCNGGGPRDPRIWGGRCAFSKLARRRTRNDAGQREGVDGIVAARAPAISLTVIEESRQEVPSSNPRKVSAGSRTPGDTVMW